MQSPNLDPTFGERTGPVRSRELDPTAGERARLERRRPGVAHPVTDPTDPRYAGLTPVETRHRATDPARIVDPTDPQCGTRGD